MDPIALAVATALLGAMATDAWQEARTAVVTWWRKNHPELAADISRELDSTYFRVTAAGRSRDEDIRRALTDAWRLRFQQLVDANPSGHQELRQLLDEHLAPALPPHEQAQVRQIIHLHAQDQARQYVAGRDLHITE
jgi:hypothetical protein